MSYFLASSNTTLVRAAFFAISLAVSHTAIASPAEAISVVTYEEFGAVGDGVTDDLPAIQKAHAHANKQGLPVQSKPGATYHLGRQAITAVISTDTDWGTTRFIIDDSKGVENHRKPIFEVCSQLKSFPLKIERLTRGQTKLDLRPETDCLVYVENKNRKLFIRRGLNQNDGAVQKEVFILSKDGKIIGGIDWDYEVITKIEAQPIDTKQLIIRGGIFTNIANQMEGGDFSYWARNIQIRRSNTVVLGVTHRVTGEKEHGHPYGGFLNISKCANITLRNCVIDGRKFYNKIGNIGKSVPMGTYGYQASLVVNLLMSNCRMDDIDDPERWGVSATNFMKNFVVEDCVLSRVDVHTGISGIYVIRRSTIGCNGINAIGRGQLIVEDSTLHGGNLIMLRGDYGSTWEGEITIRNSRWIPRSIPASGPVMFGMHNDGKHDFGYPCSMPHTILIDGLTLEDSKHPKQYKGSSFFDNPIAGTPENPPFPFALTEKIEIKNLKTASGILPRVSNNPELTKSITVVPDSAVQKNKKKPE